MTPGGAPVGLAVAKAPVPGRREDPARGPGSGHDAAARLAAAALLDTLDACEAAFGADRCYLALDADLADGADGPTAPTAPTGQDPGRQRTRGWIGPAPARRRVR